MQWIKQVFFLEEPDPDEQYHSRQDNWLSCRQRTLHVSDWIAEPCEKINVGVAVRSNSLYADRYCGAEGSSGDPFQMAERILWCLKGWSRKWQPMALVAHAEWCREGPDVQFTWQQCDFLYIARHNTMHPFPVCLASFPIVPYSVLFRCDLSNHCLHSLEITLSGLPFAADRTLW